MPKKKKSTTAASKPWWKTRGDKLVFLFLLGIFFLLAPGQNYYMMFGAGPAKAEKPFPFAKPEVAPYPVNVAGFYPGEEITATGVVVLDINSGVYLYKRNADMLLSPASTTKILTALVALETYDPDEIVTIKTVQNSGQVMGLVSGERITVENLLFGALIQSGNDAAYAIAEHYPGGVEKFVEAMNAKAKELHLQNSSFTNPVGFDDVNHKMTPIDLAQLGRAALDNKTIAKMVAIPQITVSDVTHTYFHELKNVNELLGKIPGVGGIKTGWTEEAGENLITLVQRGDHKLIIVVLHSLNRFDDTSQLINWIFGSYVWEVYKPAN